MAKAKLIEALADIEHQRWGDWQQYLQNQCCDEEVREGEYTGALVIPADKAHHWQKLIATPYESLSEYSKQSDRDQVARYWPLIVEFVAEWIGQNCRDFYEGSEEFVKDWREEMS